VLEEATSEDAAWRGSRAGFMGGGCLRAVEEVADAFSSLLCFRGDAGGELGTPTPSKIASQFWIMNATKPFIWAVSSKGSTSGPNVILENRA